MFCSCGGRCRRGCRVRDRIAGPAPPAVRPSPRTPCAQASWVVVRHPAPESRACWPIVRRRARWRCAVGVPALVTDSILTRVAAPERGTTIRGCRRMAAKTAPLSSGVPTGHDNTRGLGQTERTGGGWNWRAKADWDIHVIRYGRARRRGYAPPRSDPATRSAWRSARLRPLTTPSGSPTACLPEETDLILRWLARPGVRLVHCSEGWASPVTAPAGRTTPPRRSCGCQATTTTPTMDLAGQ